MSCGGRLTLCDADVSTLMWKMRNHIITEELPSRQVVIQFHFADPGLVYDTYWALYRPGALVEICTTIPDFEVDVHVETEKISLVAILLMRTTIPREIEAGRLFLGGDAVLTRTMDRWLKTGNYAHLQEIELLDAPLATAAE